MLKDLKDSGNLLPSFPSQPQSRASIIKMSHSSSVYQTDYLDCLENFR